MASYESVDRRQMILGLGIPVAALLSTQLEPVQRLMQDGGKLLAQALAPNNQAGQVDKLALLEDLMRELLTPNETVDVVLGGFIMPPGIRRRKWPEITTETSNEVYTATLPEVWRNCLYLGAVRALKFFGGDQPDYGWIIGKPPQATRVGLTYACIAFRSDDTDKLITTESGESLEGVNIESKVGRVKLSKAAGLAEYEHRPLQIMSCS